MKDLKAGIKGYISSNKNIAESFKGEIVDEQVKWPKELGAKHPFNFEDAEKVYKKFGLINGAINKIVNNIVGEFTVSSKNANIQALVVDFVKRNNLSTVLREWLKEGFIKGNGFIEIDAKEGKCRVLNANNMWVKRNTKGEVIEYNQYTGDSAKINQRKLNNFKPNQIAHIKINPISNEAYGMGILMCNERVIENIILLEQDHQRLIARKAGAPIHVKVGIVGENADTTAIDNFNSSLKYMTNRTEWVSDANVDMKVLDFGDIGKNLTDAIMHSIRELLAGINMPEVLLNSGQLNEGIAKVQLEGWQRDMVSYQDMIEPIIVDKMINPYLEGQGIKGDVDFVWRIPGESEVNARVTSLTGILSNMQLSENMRRMIELEIARLLGLAEAEKWLVKPDGKALERDMERDIQQPEVPGAKANATTNPEKQEKPKAKEHLHVHENIDYSQMSIREFVNVKEIAGFNYSDYLAAILKNLKTDKFIDLRAITEVDIGNGLLSESDINKLRTILKEGFRRNYSMREIESAIREGIKLRDRITENGNVISANSRPENISRTETVRLANDGLIDVFKQNKVEKVRWLAAISDRTCELCMAKDGQIYDIQEAIGENRPPLHNMCRCSLISE